MEYITKKNLIDCSTPDEFCFSLCFAWNVKQYGKSTPIRFFPERGKNRKMKIGRLFMIHFMNGKKNLAFQKALNQAKEIFNICPICKRLVCDHCFLICDDLDMCAMCYKA